MVVYGKIGLSHNLIKPSRWGDFRDRRVGVKLLVVEGWQHPDRPHSWARVHQASRRRGEKLSWAGRGGSAAWPGLCAHAHAWRCMAFGLAGRGGR